MSEPADLVAKSVALLEAVGFAFIPLLHPINEVWEILCVSPRGLTLVAARKPNLMGGTYSVPAGWPAGTVRLLLIWGAAPLPQALTLS